MTNVSLTVEVKRNNKWETTRFVEHPEIVYTSLANELKAKYIHKATYIRRIVRTPLYNEFEKIVVYMTNGVKSTYIVRQ